ncbi:MAG TPA: adenosylmethionine--8-amino-7-oxononanoate transaminase [Candidatus Mailhella merdavium]|nr:adenosylmethionine--8-amino-7-oxononanoate transaminase [Candidatus Mailhella merdavium]
MNALRGCFITGSDTDAGKTVTTGALLRALLEQGSDARAVKPVQTGCLPGKKGQLLAPDTLRWQEALRGLHLRDAERRTSALRRFLPACSPHLAARDAGASLTVTELTRSCRQEASQASFTLIEGAGGVYVPLNEQEDMLDLMTALELPVLLAVGNKLGCINHALLAIEALKARGLHGLGMVLCRISRGTSDEAELLADNVAVLARRGEALGFPLLAELPFLPNLNSPHTEMQDAAWAELSSRMSKVVRALNSSPTREAHHPAPEDILSFDREHVWHPYASAVPGPEVWEAVATEGSRIHLRDGSVLVDGMSSWWCAAQGYRRPAMIRALKEQAERMPHVMFGGLTHAPAVTLAQKLIRLAPEGLTQVFFADSGSVAVEVAIKLCLQYRQAEGKRKKTRLAALRGAYHGDTCGAMSLCDPVTGMHHLFTAVLPRQLFLDRPSCRFDRPFDPAGFTETERILRQEAPTLSAVVVEPIVQGAGGMWFYHPEYLRRLRRLCDELDILLVADEIATGFGRTGRLFASEWAGISPDIMCLGKALTGGTMTLSAVLVGRHIAERISHPAVDAVPGLFMHGPTFMANPLACAVAGAAVDDLLNSPWQENVRRIEARLARGLEACRNMPGVSDVRVLGAIGVVETQTPVNVENLQKFFVQHGVWIRPFHRTVYLMPPFITADADLDALTSAVRLAFEQRMHL